MKLRDWIIPQEKIFFELLKKESKNVLKGAIVLDTFMNNSNSIGQVRKKIKNIENEGDEIVHQIYSKLDETFITPIDHEDISKLASLYDDIIDLIYAISNRLFLFKINKSNETMKKFSRIIIKSVKEIDGALEHIRKVNKEEIDKRCIEIDTLENEADELLNESIASLFKQKNPVSIIKLKEIYEFLEQITDKCEDIAYVLRDIVIKNR